MDENTDGQTDPANAPRPSASNDPPWAAPLSLNELGTVALKYVALAAGVGALAFAIKTLLLVGMNAQVAAALVTNTSVSTAIQVLLAVAPHLGLILALTLVYQAGQMSKRGHRHSNPQSWVPLLALALALLGPALLMFDSWVVVLPIYAAGQTFFAGRSRHGKSYLRVTFGLVVIAAIFFFYSAGMWLPKERIQVDGKDYLIHVTSESDDSLVGYFPANRAVLRLPKPKVEQRQYCGTKTPSSFASSWIGSPVLPECPSVEKPLPTNN